MKTVAGVLQTVCNYSDVDLIVNHLFVPQYVFICGFYLLFYIIHDSTQGMNELNTALEPTNAHKCMKVYCKPTSSISTVAPYFTSVHWFANFCNISTYLLFVTHISEDDHRNG